MDAGGAAVPAFTIRCEGTSTLPQVFLQASTNCECERIASSATVVAFNASPEVAAQAFVMPFVWGAPVVSVPVLWSIIGVVYREIERQASPHHAGSA